MQITPETFPNLFSPPSTPDLNSILKNKHFGAFSAPKPKFETPKKTKLFRRFHAPKTIYKIRISPAAAHPDPQPLAYFAYATPAAPIAPASFPSTAGRIFGPGTGTDHVCFS